MHMYFTSSQLTLLYCLLNFERVGGIYLKCTEIKYWYSMILLILEMLPYQCARNQRFIISREFLEQNIHMYSLLVKINYIWKLEEVRSLECKFCFKFKIDKFAKAYRVSHQVFHTHFLFKRTFFSKYPINNHIEELSNFAISMKILYILLHWYCLTYLMLAMYMRTYIEYNNDTTMIF